MNKVFIRNQHVLLEDAVARIYKVDVRTLRRVLGRNRDRFPDETIFKLTHEEMKDLGLTLTKNRKWRPEAAPYAFTDFAFLMAANILNSDAAIKASLRRIRTVCREEKKLLGGKSVFDILFDAAEST